MRHVHGRWHTEMASVQCLRSVHGDMEDALWPLLDDHISCMVVLVGVLMTLELLLWCCMVMGVLFTRCASHLNPMLCMRCKWFVEGWQKAADA